MKEHFSVLIIEEDAKNANLVKECLHANLGIKFHVEQVFSLEEAFLKLAEKDFDFVLINLYLPDSKGLITLSALQKITDVPLVLIGNLEEETAEEAIRQGAQDYVPPSECSSSLLIRVIHFSIQRENLRHELKTLSFKDELTDLYNRRGFFALFEQQYALSLRNKKGFYLFLIDLDYLKHINDTYGHTMGDLALKETARCLTESFRSYDIIGRIGGDEFAAIAIDVNEDSKNRLITQIQEQIKTFNEKKIAPFTLSVSIGVIYFDGNQEYSLEELMEMADHNLYAAKKTSHG